MALVAGAAAAPPLVLHSGQLLLHGSDPYRRIPVFLSNAGQASRCIIIFGGQTDGLFSLHYAAALIDAAVPAGWAVAQVVLASGLAGSPGTHVQDAYDLADLCKRLHGQLGMQELALFAFGTGVQVALEFLASHPEVSAFVTRVVLQGVVCDPSRAVFAPEQAQARLRTAAQLASEGRRDEFATMARLYDIPVSAGRVSLGGLLSLQEAVWGPAMDGAEAQLRQNLACIEVPLLLLCAPQTHYNVDAAAQAGVAEAVRRAAPQATPTVRFMPDEVCDERRRMLNTAEARHTAAVIGFLMEQDRLRKEAEERDKTQQIEGLRRQRSIIAKTKLREATDG